MRIISLAPSVTEILFSLGIGDQIIANTIYCDYPEVAKTIPKIGSWIRVDEKQLNELKPDLIFTSTVVQEKQALKWSERGLPVTHIDPRSFQEIYASIIEVGKKVGKHKEAKGIVEKLKGRAKKISENQPKSRLKVYIEEWFNPAMMSGNWVPDLVELAGGDYSLMPKGEISHEIPLPYLLEYQPDIIFLSYCGFKDASNPDHIFKRNGWGSLNAIKTNQVYNLDDTFLNRPGPRLLLAAEEIQRHLYGITKDR